MKITRSQLRQLIAEELNVGVPTASMEEGAELPGGPASQRDIGDLTQKITALTRRLEAIEATLRQDLGVEQIRSLRDRLQPV